LDRFDQKKPKTALCACRVNLSIVVSFFCASNSPLATFADLRDDAVRSKDVAGDTVSLIVLSVVKRRDLSPLSMPPKEEPTEPKQA